MLEELKAIRALLTPKPAPAPAACARDLLMSIVAVVIPGGDW